MPDPELELGVTVEDCQDLSVLLPGLRKRNLSCVDGWEGPGWSGTRKPRERCGCCVLNHRQPQSDRPTDESAERDSNDSS